MRLHVPCGSNIFVIAVAALAVCLSLGCGGSAGPKRYRIEGTVTYDGKPVAGGRIDFEPDPARGNQGPPGYAIIENGRYVTARGKGAVGGPHVVRITGTDGQPTGESPYGRMLFSSYTTTIDLPHEPATQDFDVPVSAR